MNKAQYDHQPAKMHAVGNGSYLYRWDINEKQVQHDPLMPTSTIWECYEVLVWSNTRQAVTEAVIAALWPPSVEAKLINDYNAAKENVLSHDYIALYLAFINERNNIKNAIKNVFENEII